jgi:hypothetical protein
MLLDEHCCHFASIDRVSVKGVVNSFVLGPAEEVLAGLASNGLYANWHEVVLAPNPCFSLSYVH